MDSAPDGPAPLETVADGAILHATAVAVAGRGLLILGPTGAGKSALALQMIALGATLVADDATQVRAGAQGPLVSCPAAIAGRLEARGMGLLRLPASGPVRVHCALRLTARAGPRLPRRVMIALAGQPVPLLSAPPLPHLAATLVLMLRHDTLPDDIHP